MFTTNKIIAIVILFFPLNSFALEKAASKENKFLYTNLALSGGVIAYGFANWDYGANNYKTKSEGWFQSNTKEGGADKMGHLYSSYLTSRLTSSLYKNWGFSQKEAAWHGALTSFIFTTTMEIGDGFSKYGTSHEDLIANSFGQFAGYILDINPNLDKKFDLRVEYNPVHGIAKDPLTDYDKTKYLLATKFSGFDFAQNSYLKYVEFHLGYYARGYDKFDNKQNTKRNIYAGIGINLSQIFRDLSHKKTARFFNYYQTPYTYIEANRDLNR